MNYICHRKKFKRLNAKTSTKLSILDKLRLFMQIMCILIDIYINLNIDSK